MPNAERFRPNSPPVIQETIDLETIIVNLDSGCYYSLNPAGTHIWVGLERGLSVDEVTAHLSADFDVEAAVAEPDVHRFVDQLTAEELIVSRDREGGESAAGNGDGGLSGAPAYEAPSLSRYTDMQELLLLDPVHEVDVTGWPARDEAPRPLS